MSVLILLNVKEKNFTSTLSTNIAKKLTAKNSKSKILLRILVGKKQNVCARQQNKQANKFFCEIFVECKHFFSVLHIAFTSPFFLKEVDENYPKKIFRKALEDNNSDVLEFLLLFFWIYVETNGCDHRVHAFTSHRMS